MGVHTPRLQGWELPQSSSLVGRWWSSLHLNPCEHVGELIFVLMMGCPVFYISPAPCMGTDERRNESVTL